MTGRMSSCPFLLSCMSSYGSRDHFPFLVTERLDKVLAFLMVWPGYPVRPVRLVQFHHGECLPHPEWRLDSVMATVLPNQKESYQEFYTSWVLFSRGGWKNEFLSSFNHTSPVPLSQGKKKKKENVKLNYGNIVYQRLHSPFLPAVFVFQMCI